MPSDGPPQADVPSRRAAVLAVGIRRSLTVLMAAVLLGIGCAPATSDRGLVAAVDSGQLDTLHASCMDAMIKSTCRVSSGGAPSSDPEGAVFVAGVGQVDAASYRQLRESGDAMCTLMKQSCAENWTGVRCQTARSLWTAAAPITTSAVSDRMR